MSESNRATTRSQSRTGDRTELIRAAAIALGRIGASEALADLKVVARRPWLFRSRRIAAHDAAVWAVSTLQGEMTGEAPEARLRTRQSTDANADADDRADDEAIDSADA